MKEIEVTEKLPQISETVAIMSVIERCALNPEVDIDKMQKLLDMQERILDRNAKQAFTSALARMQAELPTVIEKGQISINGKVQSTYGLLEDINDQVRPILQKHGFAITFRVLQNEKSIKVTAVLSHQEGHAQETEMVLPSDTTGNKNAVQAVGSSISYGKRYTMCALLNITTRGEDDDGRSATKEDFATLAQQNSIGQLAAKLTEEKKMAFKKSYPKISEIKKSEVDLVIAKLKRSLEAQGANNA